MDIDIFMQRGIWNLNIVSEKGDAAVGIDFSLLVQTKDIIGGDIGFRERKRNNHSRSDREEETRLYVCCWWSGLVIGGGDYLNPDNGIKPSEYWL